MHIPTGIGCPREVGGCIVSLRKHIHSARDTSSTNPYHAQDVVQGKLIDCRDVDVLFVPSTSILCIDRCLAINKGQCIRVHCDHVNRASDASANNASCTGNQQRPDVLRRIGFYH